MLVPLPSSSSLSLGRPAPCLVGARQGLRYGTSHLAYYSNNLPYGPIVYSNGAACAACAAVVPNYWYADALARRALRVRKCALIELGSRLSPCTEFRSQNRTREEQKAACSLLECEGSCAILLLPEGTMGR
jgi:hypothetical protein